MYRLLPLLVLPFALGFAPVPTLTPVRDPDRAIQQYDEQLQQKSASTLLHKRRLVVRLESLHAKLETGGKASEANAVRDLLVLVASLDSERPLGQVKPAALVRTAAVEGKYRHLLHTIYVPNDQATYSSYQDFGFWNGNTYGGQNNLRAGYWVYVYPRWFIWRDGPPVQR